MKNSNTLVFLNGKIYTVNDMNEWAEAIVVKDGRIIYVGGSEDARGFIDDGTEVIDLEGRMMLPGFVDNHCHVFLGSVYNTGIQIDFEWDVETTKKEIRRFVEEHPERDSFFGMGYSEWLFPEGQPDKELLDELCPDKPIILLSSGGHEGWCNTKALEAANLAGADVQGADADLRNAKEEYIRAQGDLKLICDKLDSFNKQKEILIH